MNQINAAEIAYKQQSENKVPQSKYYARRFKRLKFIGNRVIILAVKSRSRLESLSTNISTSVLDRIFSDNYKDVIAANDIVGSSLLVYDWKTCESLA